MATRFVITVDPLEPTGRDCCLFREMIRGVYKVCPFRSTCVQHVTAVFEPTILGSLQVDVVR